MVLAAAAIEQGADPAQLLSRFVRPGEDIFTYLMQEVYDRLTPEQNLVMKAVAAHLGEPATLRAINATAGEQANYVVALNNLLQSDLLNFRTPAYTDGSAETVDQFVQTNILRTFYYDELCSDEERTALHSRAATYYIGTGRHPWFSTLHSERGQRYNEAALIAVERLDQVISQSSWHKTDALLARLLVQPLEGILPVRVRLARARTTAAIEGWEAAVEDLKPAVELAAGDPYYAAFVRYRLAQAYFKLKEVKAASENFAVGIELLAAAPIEPAAQLLLVRLHIGLAALLIQNESDLASGKVSLDEAQRLLEVLPIAARDKAQPLPGGELDELQAQLASAWASYWQSLGNLDQAIVHVDAAWQNIRHANRGEPRFAIARNLATLLILTEDPARIAQADSLLADAEKTVEVLGHPEWRAKCRLTQGIAHHNTGEMELAVSAYLDAYAIFVDLDDRDSLFDTCFNLAEAYSKLGQCEEARRYHKAAAALLIGPEMAALHGALANLARENSECLVPED
ncbi:MAG: hypothetical protein U0X20_32720 [Caldilineaceae bacterium]